VLARVATDAKSNEITEVPELLGMLNPKGVIVPADEPNCWRVIAEQIMGQKNDALALKTNRGILGDDVVQLLDDAQLKASICAPVLRPIRDASRRAGRRFRRDRPARKAALMVGFGGHPQDGAGALNGAQTTIGVYYLLSTELEPERCNQVVLQDWA
jgi:predicted transposase YbfD/YdcC